MKGQMQIIKARLDGLLPNSVFMNIGLPPIPPMSRFSEPENALKFGLSPTVEIANDEMGKHHDFRFLTGCTVHIRGMEMDSQFVRLVEQIAEKASHVIAFAMVSDEMIECKKKEWTAWTF